MSETLSLILQIVAASFGLSGQYLVNHQKIGGYYLWVGANLVLIPISAYAGLYIMSGLYTVYLGLCLHGIWHWSKRPDSPDP